MEALKAKLKATWMSGDFDKIAQIYAPGAAEFVERLALRSGERVLDVAEGLEIRFDEGDAEQLPYEDAAFDTVITMFGAMFAPRPEKVAAELIRVSRPGGRIVMANWTPTGFIGQMFKTTSAHVPPPPGMPCRRLCLGFRGRNADAAALMGCGYRTRSRGRRVGSNETVCAVPPGSASGVI
jgi:SAM-dependent methyltransferase